MVDNFLKQLILLSILMSIIIHVTNLYLTSTTMVDELIPHGCSYNIKLKEILDHPVDENSAKYIHPRVLYSKTINGKLFEIQHLVTFPRKIDLNRASINLLQVLPGIGPLRAGKIVKYRSRNGYFKRLEDVNSIPGFNRNILHGIELYVTFK